MLYWLARIRRLFKPQSAELHYGTASHPRIARYAIEPTRWTTRLTNHGEGVRLLQCEKDSVQQTELSYPTTLVCEALKFFTNHQLREIVTSSHGSLQGLLMMMMMYQSIQLRKGKNYTTISVSNFRSLNILMGMTNANPMHMLLPPRSLSCVQDP